MLDTIDKAVLHKEHRHVRVGGGGSVTHEKKLVVSFSAGREPAGGRIHPFRACLDCVWISCMRCSTEGFRWLTFLTGGLSKDANKSCKRRVVPAARAI